MTKEIRTLIELSDITGVEFECRKCEAKILYTTTPTRSIPMSVRSGKGERRR
jgi:hypothetical protein